MVIDMNDSRLTTLIQIQAFLDGTSDIQIAPVAPGERYAHIGQVLRRFGYARLRKPDKGVILRYLARTTGYSRQQLTRLVARGVSEGAVRSHRAAPRAGFRRRYTDQDIALLAEVDALHDTLAGPATCELLRRACVVHGDRRFERLARLSPSHLYNLRGSARYQGLRRHFTKTRPTGVAIGVRKAPAPEGRPGFIRIDSVHQGDLDGRKGLYHINAVDCVTQWQVVATCERISEAFLLPVLAQQLASFPFPILGLHADNGSEYINYQVAALLDKLNAEFTKSRPRRSNDNALAETKNGAVVRKCFGYAHIPQHHAKQVNAFCAHALNPYLNFHRPCAFAVETVNRRGKVTRRYPKDNVMTPCDKLVSLPGAAQCLKPGVTLQSLKQQALALSDSQAAMRMNQARDKLFASFSGRSRPAA